MDGFGRIDSVFANAGIGGGAKSFAEFPTETYRRVLSVNQGQVVLRTPTDIRFVGARDPGIRLPMLPEGLLSRPALVWKVASEMGGEHRVRTTYQTAGITWRADYNLPAWAETRFDGVVPHDLRHTGISLMAASGMRPETIAARVGHKDGGKLILERYRHLFPDELTQHLARYDQFIRERRLRLVNDQEQLAFEA